jgi:hypothetical protein
LYRTAIKITSPRAINLKINVVKKIQAKGNNSEI